MRSGEAALTIRSAVSDVIDGKEKATPGGSSEDERIVGGPRHYPTRDT